MSPSITIVLIRKFVIDLVACPSTQPIRLEVEEFQVTVSRKGSEDCKEAT